MLISVPTRQYHPITKQEIEPCISLVNLDFTYIETIDKEIDEDTNIGYTTIYFRNGNMIQLLIEFEDFFILLNNGNVVNNTFLNQVKDIDIDFKNKIGRYGL